MSRPTILLVDNDKKYRESLRLLMEEDGYLVEEADSVDSGLHKLASTSACLCVVDMRLTNDENPGDISGLQVVRQAGMLNVPSIVTTAFPSWQAARLTLASGVTDNPGIDYMQKGERPEIMLSAIRQMLPLIVLHISDLHLNAVANDIPVEQDRSLEEFYTDITRLELEQRLHQVRTIVVSGDLSYQHQATSFDAAYRFLTSLCEIVGVPFKDVVLVPGNHDIDREATGSSKYEPYLHFISRFYGGAIPAGPLLFDGKLAIAALDSCVREGDPLYQCPVCSPSHYYGWVGPDQVRGAARAIEDRTEKGQPPPLRIAACHHHVVSAENEWKIEEGIQQSGIQICCRDHLRYHTSDLKKVLGQHHFSILLHGHSHKGKLRQPEDVGSKMPYTFGSGTLWLSDARRGSEGTYLLLYLSPIARYSRVIVRRYHPTENERLGYWGPDDSVRVDGVIPLHDVSIPKSLGSVENQENGHA